MSSVDEAEALGLEVSHMVAQAVADESIWALGREASSEGSSRACACGRRAKFVGYRGRGVATLAGVVDVKPAYYHCRSGQLPWDLEQGLNGRLWTPGVKALVAELVAHLP